MDEEKAQILAILESARQSLSRMFADVTEEQARATPTASALCLGGILKHVTYGETIWVDFIVEGEKVDDLDRYAASFRMEPAQTVARLLDDYAAAAKRTEEVVAGLPSLDVAHKLPEAPWYADSHYSARQVLLHLIAETSQHAGHADILTETLVRAQRC